MLCCCLRHLSGCLATFQTPLQSCVWSHPTAAHCLPLLGPGHSLGSSIPVSQTKTGRSRVRGRWKPVPPVGPHVDTVTFPCAWDELAAPSPAFLGLLTPWRGSATGRTVRPGVPCRKRADFSSVFMMKLGGAPCGRARAVQMCRSSWGHPGLIGGCLGVDGGVSRHT